MWKALLLAAFPLAAIAVPVTPESDYELQRREAQLGRRSWPDEGFKGIYWEHADNITICSKEKRDVLMQTVKNLDVLLGNSQESPADIDWSMRPEWERFMGGRRNGVDKSQPKHNWFVCMSPLRTISCHAKCGFRSMKANRTMLISFRKCGPTFCVCHSKIAVVCGVLILRQYSFHRGGRVLSEERPQEARDPGAAFNETHHFPLRGARRTHPGSLRRYAKVSSSRDLLKPSFFSTSSHLTRSTAGDLQRTPPCQRRMGAWAGPSPSVIGSSNSRVEILRTRFSTASLRMATMPTSKGWRRTST